MSFLRGRHPADTDADGPATLPGDSPTGRLKGGILLVIGVLHGLNIVLMPMLGRLFSLDRRLPDAAVTGRRRNDYPD